MQLKVRYAAERQHVCPLTIPLVGPHVRLKKVTPSALDVRRITFMSIYVHMHTFGSASTSSGSAQRMPPLAPKSMRRMPARASRTVPDASEAGGALWEEGRDPDAKRGAMVAHHQGPLLCTCMPSRSSASAPDQGQQIMRWSLIGECHSP